MTVNNKMVEEKIICEYCKQYNHRSEFETSEMYIQHLRTSQHEISYNAFMAYKFPNM